MTYVAVSANQRTQNRKYYLWRQTSWDCIRGRAMKSYPRYLLVNVYQTIPKVGLWKMWHILSREFHSCILFELAAWGSRIFSNKDDILSEVMYLYSTGGLTCFCGFRGNVCMYCKLFKVESNRLEQDTYLISHS